MNPITHSILSISPSRGRLGVAVFRRGRLIYYGVKSLRQFQNGDDLRSASERILAKLFKKYCIGTLMMPVLNRQQSHSTVLVSIDRTCRDLARHHKVSLQPYDPLAVRRILCQEAKPTKANASDKLVEIYPELSRHNRGGSQWERRYYGYLFGAIAAFKACEFDKQNSAKKALLTNSPHRQQERLICT